MGGGGRRGGVQEMRVVEVEGRMQSCGGRGGTHLNAGGGGGGQDAVLSPHQPVVAVLVLILRHVLRVPLLQPVAELVVLVQRHLAVGLEHTGGGNTVSTQPSVTLLQQPFGFQSP